MGGLGDLKKAFNISRRMEDSDNDNSVLFHPAKDERLLEATNGKHSQSSESRPPAILGASDSRVGPYRMVSGFNLVQIVEGRVQAVPGDVSSLINDILSGLHGARQLPLHVP
ncbi:MAG: hypothetical protein GHCLOJNM_01944 [bacterium]|nr:hypothetical protein [bacterium]